MKRSDTHRKKGKGSGIFYLAGAAILILAAGGGYYYYHQTQEALAISEGEKTIQQFIDRLNTGDYEKAMSYTQINSKEKAALSEKEALEKYQNIYV